VLATQAPTGTGDDRDPSVERTHDLLLCSRFRLPRGPGASYGVDRARESA
jgi:hypothetical protein